MLNFYFVSLGVLFTICVGVIVILIKNKKLLYQIDNKIGRIDVLEADLEDCIKLPYTMFQRVECERCACKEKPSINFDIVNVNDVWPVSHSIKIASPNCCFKTTDMNLNNCYICFAKSKDYIRSKIRDLSNENYKKYLDE